MAPSKWHYRALRTTTLRGERVVTGDIVEGDVNGTTGEDALLAVVRKGLYPVEIRQSTKTDIVLDKAKMLRSLLRRSFRR